MDHCKIVFQVLHDNNLTIQMNKCLFATDSVEYLGLQLGAKGVTLPCSKVPLLEQLRSTVPSTKKQLRRLVGILNFFRDGVHNFSMKLAPVLQLC
jgi:hypothetical protein